METPHVLVLTASRSIRRRINRALASAGYPVDNCSLERAEVEQALGRSPGMCIIDADADPAAVRWCLATLYNEHQQVISLLVSHDSANELIVELITDHNLNNLIAKHGAFSASNDLIDETELIVTCQKLFLRDIFGIEKYLPTWGIKIHDHLIEKTEDRKQVLHALDSFLEATDCFGPIKSAVGLVADELLMNAIFNAPRDEQGRAKYADVDRNEQFALAPEEKISCRYACDGRNVVLSVADHFGSLSRETVIKYLARCFTGGRAEMEEKRAGAGLGLYMVFNSITQLTFNIHAGVSTEVIALFYVRSGSRAFRSAGRSLNLFLLR